MPIHTLAITTAGGDGPGMNAGIRSVVRSALSQGLKIVGIMKGYDGLIDDLVIEMDHRSVSNIINRGGTILKTARSPRIRTPEGMAKAAETVKKHKIDGMVVIGGDGTYRAAAELWEKYKIPIVGIPGTIDNDITGTDHTISSDTAINTALDAIDKIRDTSQSMERIFVIEVMGNKSGFIAMEVALAGGAEDVIIPELEFDYEEMFHRMKEGHKAGKANWLVVTAEGAAKAVDVAEKITKGTGLETRCTVLGHIQRGGVPVASDRVLATRLGNAAVNLLVKGEYGKAVGILKNEINVVDLKDARRTSNLRIDEYYRLIKTLT
ncbi:MAG: 6-phosphofructokinase [Candidatus Omnitrophota bacterium]|nr:6-phosphofructokinase [Candidatus Omnitrophota bacterium]MDZ4242474.1 6-phosphofructokinase [Candidatus Omnitrophota bacterium]